MNKEILKDLGLTNNETEVYLTLIRLGSVTVNVIAEKSGLHRQACYDALDRLLEKGFVSFVTKNNSKHFSGVHPEKILSYLKEKEDNFKLVLPELLNLVKTPKEDTSVEVFKGSGIVKTIMRDITNEAETFKEDVLIMGVDERDFVKDNETVTKHHLIKMRKMGIKERVLVEEGDTYFLEGPQTEYRWFPKNSFSPIPMFVYGSKMAIIIWGNPNYAIVIDNRRISDSYRKQFDMLWKISKKIPAKHLKACRI